MKKINFGKPIIDHNEINSVKNVLKSGIYVHGKKCLEFENNFKKFTNAKYAVSVSSCTAGMHLVYFTLGIGRGDEVIVPSQTHTATAHAVELSGAKPIFVDCDRNTGNIAIDLIQKKINSKTKAIVVVHFLGIPVEMDKILEISKKNNLKVIEDCALSLGAKYKDTHTGLLGDVGVFSFYPVKHMTTGEGGIILTKNKKLEKQLKINRALGINKQFNDRKLPGFYDAVNLGFNYRMSEIHACIGVEQLKKINSFLKIRKQNFEFLVKILSKNNQLSILQSNNKFCESSYYCCSVIINNKSVGRNNLILKLKSKNIITSIYYPQPVPRMSFYKKKYKYNKKQFTNSELISDRSIALPVGPHLNLRDMKIIAKNLIKEMKKINEG